MPFKGASAKIHLSMTSLLLSLRRTVVCMLVVGLAGMSSKRADAQAGARVKVATTRSDAALAEAADAGEVPATQKVELVLTLAPTPERAAALDGFLRDVTSAGSANWHKWVTPAEFAGRYGATAEQIETASAWARAQGMSVEGPSSGGSRLRVSGAAFQVEAALAVKLHLYQISGLQYFANVGPASLEPGIAPTFAAISGLDNLPGGAGVKALGDAVDANSQGILAMDAPASVGADFAALFRQAAAQGITVVSRAGAGAFPEVTAVALAGDHATTADTDLRPGWQVAAGLPEDGLRYAPDLAAVSVNGLAQALAGIALSAGGRLGNVNPVLYALAGTPGLFSQPDGAPAGTWEPATGLGTIDLKVLATVFPRGSGSSFTSFAANNYSPTHGQGLSLTSNVTSGTGGAVPTGSVSFVTSTGTTLGTVALVNGSATFSTNKLDGGSYTIGAVYSGDATYAPSSSPTSGLFIKPEASLLSVTVSGGAVVGSPFTVIVTDTAASGIARPSGPITVTLPVNGATYTGTLVPAGVNSATATITIPSTTVGTTTLAVNCAATLSFSCDNPYTTTVTIAKATPTLNISYTPNPPVSGGAITLSATVAGVGTAPVPTGNVRFLDNGTMLNAGALLSGSTTTTGTVPTTPTHSITATYDGDANYNSVSTSAGSTSSGAIATTTALSASSSTVTAGQNVTFTAVVTPGSTGSAGVSGTVQFLDGAVLLGTSTVTGNVATFSTSALSATANHSVIAIYGGDTNYTGSTSNTVPVGRSTVPITTSTALTASSGSVVAGQSISFTATVTPAATGIAPVSGTVQFFDGATPLGTATLAGGSAVFSTSLLSSNATHSISAVYTGDTIYGGSTSQAIPLSPTKTATVAALTATPSTATTGTAITLSTIVTPTVNNVLPTGTVLFTTGNVSLCTTTLSAGAASCSVTTLPTGTSNVQSTYLGDANYGSSVSNVVAVNVVASNTSSATLTASISPANAVAGGVATVSAVVAAPVGTVPSGSVTATIVGVPGAVYSVAIASMPNTNQYTVMIPVTVPATAGPYSVVVACVGSNFTCTPVTLALVSSASSTTKIGTATVLTGSMATGGVETLTATVTPASAGSAAPSGTVTFFDGTTLIGSGIVTSGVATATVTLSGTASHSLTAAYTGDTLYAPSTSAAFPVGTGATPATITLRASSSSGLAGTSVTLTAQVSGATAAGVGPTGNVSFFLSPGGTLLGTARLGGGAGGVATATLTTTTLAAGTQTIYAVYAGDANFGTLTSNIVVIGVSDYNLTFIPQTLTLTRGQAGQVTVILGIVNGFAGSVVFGCTPPANTQITCSFNPTVLMGGGTTTMTISTVAPKSLVAERAGLGVFAMGASGPGALLSLLALSALLCVVIPGKRRGRLPTLLMVLLALGMTANLGCSDNGGTTASGGTGNLNPGTPLGTFIVTVNTAGTDGVNTAHHDYAYQVTVQ